MAELVYQTYQRLTGKPWSQAKKDGLTDGSASANLALQKKLLSGWNPYTQPAPQAAPAQAAPVVNEDQKQRDYLNSPEYAAKIDTQVRSVYDPELKNIDIEKDLYNQDIEDAIKAAKKNQETQNRNFLEQQSKYGFLRSTPTSEGIENIATDTTETLNRYESNRANRLAQFALQKTAVETKITTQKQSVIDQAKSEFEKAISQRDQDAFERAMKMASLAADMEEGTSIDLGGFGVIQGTKKVKASSSGGGGGGSSKPTSTQIKSSLLSNIDNGLQQIINEGSPAWATEQMIDELYGSYREYGYTKDQVAKFVYDARRPLESKHRF